MLKNLQFTFTLTIAFFLGCIYFALLSDSGYMERRKLEKKLSKIKLEVERFENENTYLQAKKIKLKNDDVALAIESRKYYFLNENARVIKFKDEKAEEPENDDLLLASRLINHLPQSKSQLNVYRIPDIKTLRAFYAIVSAFICIGVFLRFRNH
ncbi:MAG: septum formation initiator family protein [Leptospiraceae bacterium]|nr:septum formation initiator family protein [Leptospiraceae bacterium]MCP5494643.1 septum formation initiator family protein [Leptospiraceae bacterium]